MSFLDGRLVLLLVVWLDFSIRDIKAECLIRRLSSLVVLKVSLLLPWISFSRVEVLGLRDRSGGLFLEVRACRGGQ